MKYVLIVFVFCVCTFIGYLFSLKYSKRKKFFDSLILFADKLSLDINFSRDRLKVLMNNFDPVNKKNLLGIDEQFCEYLDKKIDLTSDNVFTKADVLKTEEKECVLLFLKALGRSDVENQTKEIQNFITRFNEMKTLCDSQQKKYGSLSIKLGIVAGLFWAVILI